MNNEQTNFIGLYNESIINASSITTNSLEIIGSLLVDTINERTTNNGVDIESVNIKDGLVDGVDIPVLQDRSEHVFSSGLYDGGILSIGSPNTTFSITDGYGLIVDNTVNPHTVTSVHWTGKTNIPVTNISSQLLTYVLIDSNGDVIQQSYKPTNDETRDYIYIGVVVHVNLTNVDTVNQQQQFILSPSNQIKDLMEALGFLNLSGNTISPVVGTLQINKSSGYMLGYGINYYNDPKDPHKLFLNSFSSTTSPIQYRLQDGSNMNPSGAPYNVDPNFFNPSAGTLTAVPPNKFTVQRIYTFTSNNVKLMYGQTVYNSLASAKDNLRIDPFNTEASIEENGLLIGYMIIKQGTTDLSNSSDVFFIQSTKFDSSAFSVGGTTLQLSYDNSITPEILTDSTRGALSLKRGSSSDSDNVLEIMNGSGVVRCSIAGDGSIYNAGLTASSFIKTNASSVLTTKQYIDNSDIDNNAGIVDTKLATISTSGKVNNSATTGTTSNIGDTLVLRSASGNFDANVITATLNGTSYYIKNDYVITSYPLTVLLCDGSSSSSRATTNGSVTYNPLTGRFGSGIIVSQSDQATTVAITETTSGLSSFFLCFVDTRSGYENIQAGGASYVPTGNIITANLSGNVTGNSTTSTTATTANNIKSDSSVSGTVYLTLVSSSSSSTPVGINGFLTYDTTTNKFGSSVRTVRSDYTDYSDSSYITSTPSSASTFYIPYVDGTNAYKNLNTGLISYTPLINRLSCDISGDLYGNASTCDTALYANNVNLSGGSSATNYILFSTGQTGNNPVYTNSNILFNGSSNTLICPNITGTITNATQAVNSTNVGITSNNTSASNHYICMTTSSGGTNDNIKIDTSFRYTPQTDTLYCSLISGTCSNAILSDTSTLIGITSDNSSASTHYITFTNATSGNGSLKVDSANLTYVPSTDTLSVTNISSTNITGTCTNATNLTGSGTISSTTTCTTQPNGTDNTSIATTEFVNNVVPVGCVQMYIATTAPNSNWMVCDGSAISRTTYATLFSIISTTYGSGDGSTTFNIPDMRERMPYGYKVTSNALNTKSGNTSVTLTTNELPAHTHTMSHTLSTSTNYQTESFTLNAGLRGGGGTQMYRNNGISGSITASSTGSGNSFSIMNPYISINFIIKVL